MASIDLAPNECVLLTNDSVRYGSIMSGYTNQLVLTNQSVVLVLKGLFGGVKGEKRFPLAELKKFNGIPQVKVEKASNGDHELVLYLNSGVEKFVFQTSFKTTAQKWANEIINTVTGENQVSTYSAIPGTEFVAQAVKGTVDSVKNIFGIKEKLPEYVSARCPHCGATVTGIKGQSIKCEYCDSYLSL